jgi:hypothetical protein
VNCIETVNLAEWDVFQGTSKVRKIESSRLEIE